MNYTIMGFPLWSNQFRINLCKTPKKYIVLIMFNIWSAFHAQKMQYLGYLLVLRTFLPLIFLLRDAFKKKMTAMAVYGRAESRNF